MPNSHCQYIDKEGNHCRGYTRNNSQFCFMHDPACQEARLVAAMKGGKSKKQAVIENVNLRTYEDYNRITEETLNGVRNGTYTPQQANAINRLLTAFRLSGR